MQEKGKSSGFTIIEAMIGAAVLSIVALAMSSMFIQQAQQQRSVQVKMNQQQLVMVMQRAAGNPAALWASANKMVPATILDDLTPPPDATGVVVGGDGGGLGGGVVGAGGAGAGGL